MKGGDDTHPRGIAAVIMDAGEVEILMADGSVLTGVFRREYDSIDWMHNVEDRTWFRLSDIRRWRRVGDWVEPPPSRERHAPRDTGGGQDAPS